MAQLSIKFYPIYQAYAGDMYVFLHYQAVQFVSQPEATVPIIIIGTPQDPTATPYPVFPTLADARDYYDTTKCAEVVSIVNGLAGTSYYDSYDLEEIDPPVLAAFGMLAAVASSGNYSDLLGKPSLFSGAYADLTGKPTIPTITAGTHIADAATNAPNNSPTNLNVVTTLLGTLVGQVNSTNANQNTIANDYNDLATKFNTLLDRLEANGLLASS